MKICTKCGVKKLELEFELKFYKAREKSYYGGSCKNCIRIYQRESRRVYRKKRYQNRKEYHLELCRLNRQTEDGKKNHRESVKRSINKYPERQSARIIAREALRRGEIIKPDKCLYPTCKEIKIEKHHEDYALPLVVKWFCKKHHILADNIKKAKDNINP